MNKDNATRASGSSAPACSQFSDTQRLEFLMRFFKVADTGDEDVCPGVIVNTDAVSDAFDCGPLIGEVITLMDGWENPDMRRVIDKAIAFHPE